MTRTSICAPLLMILAACGSCGTSQSSRSLQAPQNGSLPGRNGCEFVESGEGPEGTLPITAEKIITGLEVPWAVGFLPDGSALITERPGRVRRAKGNALADDPVLELEVGERGEGGLMGLAIDPAFSSNRFFYVYYTTIKGGANVNRVERYRLNEEFTQASLDGLVIDDIPAGPLHNGGELRFGPDGALYLGTGDARQPDLAQDPSSRAGKLLKIDPSTGATQTVLLGIRNLQGFDWWDDTTLITADHGPSGELGLTGRDEVSLAKPGDNLGWPKITACETQEGLVTPFLAWNQANPPGGALVYRGNALPSLNGSILFTSLLGEHLHRITPEGAHETYFHDFGRLRDITQAPDGSIWVTTSNCDGRGACGSERDVVIRITQNRQ